MHTLLLLICLDIEKTVNDSNRIFNNERGVFKNYFPITASNLFKYFFYYLALMTFERTISLMSKGEKHLQYIFASFHVQEYLLATVQTRLGGYKRKKEVSLCVHAHCGWHPCVCNR